MDKLKMPGRFRYSLLLCISIFILINLRCDLLVWDGDPPPQINVLTTRDSTAVRALLDANGLQDVGVRDVINLQDSRVGTINFNTIGITSFVFTSALDTFTSGFRVNVIDCPVETLLVLDTIHIDLTIGIARTNLREIPDNISLFKGYLYLYLPDNQIRYISPEIMQCDIGFIDISNNRLCTVSDSLNYWILSKRPNTQNWQSTQKCN